MVGIRLYHSPPLAPLEQVRPMRQFSFQTYPITLPIMSPKFRNLLAAGYKVPYSPQSLSKP